MRPTLLWLAAIAVPMVYCCSFATAAAETQAHVDVNRPDSCGWRVAAPVWTTTVLNKPGTIGLLINGVETAPPQSILLQATLESVDINADAIIDPTIPPGNVRLVVGRRE